MDMDGKQMSMYGKCEVNPIELDGLWKNVLSRTDAIRRNHLANKGPGVKHWSRAELDLYNTSIYDHRRRRTVADVSSTYDRLFHAKDGFDCKIHRDDRKQIKSVGIAVQEEEQYRMVPVLSSSCYGRRLDKPLQPFVRQHARKEHILKGFYYRRGTGLPPLDM